MIPTSLTTAPRSLLGTGKFPELHLGGGYTGGYTGKIYQAVHLRRMHFSVCVRVSASVCMCTCTRVCAYVYMFLCACLCMYILPQQKPTLSSAFEQECFASSREAGGVWKVGLAGRWPGPHLGSPATEGEGTWGPCLTHPAEAQPPST